MRAMAAALAGMMLMTGGCMATRGPAVRMVEVPVARACVPDSLPPAPLFADSRGALAGAAGVDERYRLLAAEWMRRAARLDMLESVIEACR